ncbi:MAG TPA: pyridoxamine 5'-phosphate oxidase family protein [Acidimicrobiales bacterium]
MKEQRRSRRIAMTPEERDAFLAEERTCRLASVSGTGAPHVTPLWFVWDGSALWLNSIVQSQRWTDVMREPRVSAIVDAGVEFGELRGVELRGRVDAIGEVPRTGEPVPELDAIERLSADKYSGGQVFRDGRHAWLRLTPEKIVSWDFRKMGGG